MLLTSAFKSYLVNDNELNFILKFMFQFEISVFHSAENDLSFETQPFSMFFNVKNQYFSY